MPGIVWDKIGDRYFETGVSKGVVYLDSGKAIPWNGLISVSESSGEPPTPVYYDGQKISDQPQNSDFSATITAYTYPEEIFEAQGFTQIVSGAFIGEQTPTKFNMSYQSKVGNDLDLDLGYKIHILYNVTATPSDSEYASISDSLEAIEFSWDITTVPEEYLGLRPTSYIVLDSRTLSSEILSQIENMLYGGIYDNPDFPKFENLMALLFNYYTIEIIDNKDGTWTAISKGSDISVGIYNDFTINNVDAVFLDADTYEVSSTRP